MNLTKTVNADIKHIETIGNETYFSVKNEVKPTINTIWIFLYNDKDNNKKCDKGELLVVDVESVMEKEAKISVDTNVTQTVYGVDYNAYEIYYNDM